MVAGLRMLARLFRAAPMAELVTNASLPGDPDWTDEAVRAHVRARAASMLHPVGSCRMGDDALAVVDARLRVHGVTGLRVADASVMPSVPSGNTNAPTVMVGSKAAETIREDTM